MYAIVDFKGKQLKVEKDRVLKVPYLAGKEAGTEIEMDKILLFQGDKKTKIGKPIVKKVKVIAEVLEHGKDKKIIVFKKKEEKVIVENMVTDRIIQKLKLKILRSNRSDSDKSEKDNFFGGNYGS